LTKATKHTIIYVERCNLNIGVIMKKKPLRNGRIIYIT